MSKKDDVDLGKIFMHTANGQKYFPFAPNPEHVRAEVIAHHLACKARWSGATQHKDYRNRIFYSVAEHSVLCALYIEEILRRPDLAFMTLLHDAAESYNGDLIRPLKYSPEFYGPFKVVEDLNEVAIAKCYDLPHPLPPEVKIADNAVCWAEYEQIVPRDAKEDWSEVDIVEPEIKAPFEIEMMHPYEAKKLFLHHFERLAMDQLVAA